MPSRDFIKKTRLCDRRNNPDLTCSQLVQMNLVQLGKQKQQSSKKRPWASINKYSTNCNDFAIVALIQKLLNAHGDCSTKVYVDSKGRYHGRIGNEGRKCLIKGEINISDNCFFTISDDGIITYYCFDGEAHPVCSGIPIGQLKNQGGAEC